MRDRPLLTLGGGGGSDAGEMRQHIEAAMAAHAQKNPKRAAAALHAAEVAARRGNLLREAAKIRKALTMLAQGQVPRLLVRQGWLDRE